MEHRNYFGKFEIKYVFFDFLSIVNIIMIVFLKQEIFNYLIMIYLLGLVICNKISNEVFLIYAMFVPDKYLQLLCIPIYLLKSKSLIPTKLKRTETFFLASTFGISVLSCLIYNGIILGTIFQTLIYYCIFRLISNLQKGIEAYKVYSIFDNMFVLQCICITIQMLYYKNMGDPITGTLISAHYLGCFICIYLYLTLELKKDFKKSHHVATRIGVSIFILYLADAKHVWVFFLFCCILVKIFRMLKIKKQLIFTVGLMTIIILLFVFSTKIPFIASFVGKNQILSTYILNPNYNKKMDFFSKTFDNMIGINGIVGYGIGQYGSQISLTMSKGIIYEWNPHYSWFNFAITPYREAITGIMTKWYVNEGIGISSMVLGYPLVSYISMFAELGLVGYFLFVYILEKNMKKADKVFMMFFFILSIFDTYLEIPCVFVLLLIASFATKENNKELE